MRSWFVLVVALTVLGCSETSGTSGAGGGGEGGAAGLGGSSGSGGEAGSAGTGGWAGNCGPHGFGGGAAFLAPGLWRNNPGGEDDDVCFYVNEDCTGLTPSTECDIGDDDEEAHFLEIQWANGQNESGELCSDRIAVTADFVTEVPIRFTSFRIELTDGEGADWLIDGEFVSSEAWVHARRTEGESYCEVADYPGLWASPPGLY